jgi:hypothetical protein
MADIFNIDIKFNRFDATIPQVVHVPLGTILKFNISDLDNFFSSTLRDRNSRIELYFENPEGLGMENVYSRRLSYFTEFEGQLYQRREIAQGIARKKGKYKYGLRVLTNNEMRYDEDPYIIVE